MRVSPSLVIAGAALFLALGGSAVAVTEAVKPQARCQPGAVERGHRILHVGDQRVQLRRVEYGHRSRDFKQARIAHAQYRSNRHGAPPRAR